MIIDISDTVNFYKKNKLINSTKYTNIKDLSKVLSDYKVQNKKVYLILREKLYKEKDKYIELGNKLKIRKLIIKERPLIEVNNSELLTCDASGNLIVNFYREDTEVNLISLNNDIKYEVYDYSYNELIKEIKEGIKKKLKYDLDEFTCELIYQEIYLNNKKYIEVEGHKIRARKLSKIRIKETDLNKYIVDYLTKMMKSINKFIDTIYPVLKRDILDTGIVIYSNYLNQNLLDKVGNNVGINLFYINDNNNMINTYKGIN